MAVDLDQAAQFLAISAEEPVLPGLVTVAEQMVTDYLRPSGIRRVPVEIRDHAVMVLTGELWQRRNSPGGVASWSPDGVTPVRLSRDVMMIVRPILDPYRGFGGVG